MNTEDVTKNIWKNSISNYGCLILRMVLGLVMFRMLYQGLSKEEFGFWALLWSVFGFGILLDFGFGFTAVKRVAELSVHQKWEQLSRVLSTIFFLYVAAGFLIMAVGFIGAEHFIGWFKVSAANKEHFKNVLILFFCGMGLAFPLGIFPEILIGQQRIFLANVLFSIGYIANAVLIACGLKFQWGLEAIVTVALSTSIASNAFSAICAFQKMPQVRVKLSLFSWNMVRETMSFSIYAYISTLSNIILGKTDQLVISTTLGVSRVSLYQAGAKVGEMFTSFTNQLPNTFSPAAAHLHAKGDKTFLQKLLVKGSRFSVMIGTPGYLIAAFYMEGLLKMLTGDAQPSRETFWIGQVLLLWGYVTLVTQGVPKRIFMMCGHEKKLTVLGVSEAAMNLILSVGLVLYFKNVLCVALGSLIATSFFGWFFVWPWAAREANMSPWALARVVLFPIWYACLPLILFLSLGHITPWLDFRSGTLALMADGCLALIIGGIGLWFGAITQEEREIFLSKASQLIKKVKPA